MERITSEGFMFCFSGVDLLCAGFFKYCENVMTPSIQTPEHYTWGNQCSGWHLLKTDTLSVIRETMPPRTSEQMHFHRRSQQLFYILSGTATFEMDGGLLEAHAAESVHIPGGTLHCISNRTDKELAFLVISEPPSHGDRQDT